MGGDYREFIYVVSAGQKPLSKGMENVTPFVQSARDNVTYYVIVKGGATPNAEKMTPNAHIATIMANFNCRSFVAILMWLFCGYFRSVNGYEKMFNAVNGKGNDDSIAHGVIEKLKQSKKMQQGITPTEIPIEDSQSELGSTTQFTEIPIEDSQFKLNSTTQSTDHRRIDVAKFNPSNFSAQLGKDCHENYFFEQIKGAANFLNGEKNSKNFIQVNETQLSCKSYTLIKIDGNEGPTFAYRVKFDSENSANLVIEKNLSQSEDEAINENALLPSGKYAFIGSNCHVACDSDGSVYFINLIGEGIICASSEAFLKDENFGDDEWLGNFKNTFKYGSTELNETIQMKNYNLMEITQKLDATLHVVTKKILFPQSPETMNFMHAEVDVDRLAGDGSYVVVKLTQKPGVRGDELGGQPAWEISADDCHEVEFCRNESGNDDPVTIKRKTNLCIITTKVQENPDDGDVEFLESDKEMLLQFSNNGNCSLVNDSVYVFIPRNTKNFGKDMESSEEDAPTLLDSDNFTDIYFFRTNSRGEIIGRPSETTWQLVEIINDDGGYHSFINAIKTTVTTGISANTKQMQNAQNIMQQINDINCKNASLACAPHCALTSQEYFILIKLEGTGKGSILEVRISCSGNDSEGPNDDKSIRYTPLKIFKTATDQGTEQPAEIDKSTNQIPHGKYVFLNNDGQIAQFKPQEEDIENPSHENNRRCFYCIEIDDENEIVELLSDADDETAELTSSFDENFATTTEDNDEEEIDLTQLCFFEKMDGNRASNLAAAASGKKISSHGKERTLKMNDIARSQKNYCLLVKIDEEIDEGEITNYYNENCYIAMASKQEDNKIVFNQLKLQKHPDGILPIPAGKYCIPYSNFLDGAINSDEYVHVIYVGENGTMTDSPIFQNPE
ncbi:MAG: hypothetical protein LBI69_00695 [Puniceicoccales bacterium]|jgi:hypothetical protein|nr:hypothetical protein [Puniceicoccales bacterium]